MIKKIISTAVISTALLMGASNMAKAQDIEIKGFKIGMSKAEAKSNWKEVRIKSKWLNAKLIPHHYMTLAGIPVSKPLLWYNKKAEGKPVEEMAWMFCYDENDGACQMQGDKGHNTTTFATIVEALKTKFDLKCTTRELQNAFGAKFEDRTCIYKNNGYILKTERYEDDTTGGRISIYKDNGKKIVKTDDL